jgi:4-diphosphocytidyl-2-C-methyl-D-erythritol kinase
MDPLQEVASAKLNLTLDITGLRPDGYHNLVTIMQSVSVQDRLKIVREPSGIQIGTDCRRIPTDDRNLAAKAAKIFFGRGVEGGASIRIEKNIPIGAGMAGGSADAAAVLRGLNRLYGNPFSLEALEALGAEVGSDVPFCIRGGTQLARSRGTELQRLPELPPCFFVIGKPRFSISTPVLYQKYDRIHNRNHPDTEGVLRALREGDLDGISHRLYNVFEEIPDKKVQTVSGIKHRILEYGALGAVMTGSGSAVFGLFRERQKAKEAAAALRGELPEVQWFEAVRVPIITPAAT